MSQEQLDAALARASQAERSLATVTAERDETRAALASVHRDVCRGDGHDTPDMTARCVSSAFASARIDHTTDLDEMTARANGAIEERDALQAKLAEAERMRDTLGRRIDEVQAALNECGAGFTGQKESTRIRALRAQLAKTEAVVDALPWCESASECDRRATRSDGYTEFCDKHGEGWVEHPWAGALRALDAQDSPGSSSGLPDAADAPQATAQPEQRSENPQDALGNGGARGPTYRAPNDSPVGVATTACDHKRQRCENDHAVCRDCGAVNRAVTGVVDWGPPEVEALRQAMITRSELVSAVRSAASAVGGPPRRALDALADALEIPRT